LYLRPGESATARIRYGQANPWRDVVWAGRGDRWVTQIIYGARSWATGFKVVNISNRDLPVDFRMPVARIVEKDHFPSHGQFVRPGSRHYQECQQLIYENTVSQQAKLRARRFEQMIWDAQPPAVQRREYQWPTKLLVKPATPAGQVRMVKLQSKPRSLLVTIEEQPEIITPGSTAPVHSVKIVTPRINSPPEDRSML
jgi:hypothetical protein